MDIIKELIKFYDELIYKYDVKKFQIRIFIFRKSNPRADYRVGQRHIFL